jgi:predicted dehydrogenase
MDTSPTAPVRVGLVGAGPWAEMVHAPLIAAGPETVLSAVWARRPEAAAALAERHGARPVTDIAELFEVSDAVAFCVPPDVQATLAIQAARAGKALVLEKPVAGNVADAERLVEAVDASGVPTMVVLSWRYATEVRQFVERARALTPIGARGAFLSGGLLAGPFRTPWRIERGALLDLGPHVIDLVDAAAGPVRAVVAAGGSDRWVSLLLEHDSGIVSEVALSAHTAASPPIAGVEVVTESGIEAVDCSAAVGRESFANLRAELAAMVRTGVAHPLDVHRGLHLQRLIDEAYRLLSR